MRFINTESNNTPKDNEKRKEKRKKKTNRTNGKNKKKEVNIGNAIALRTFNPVFGVLGD